jgi:negative regulator of sigma-B (phosphoserine phosphatase)
VFEATLVNDDRLIMFSDGVSSRFDGASVARMVPRDACRAIMDAHRRAHDDATVLVAQIEA